MTHDFSSTQVDLFGSAADALRGIAKRIPDSHLADDGREGEPHVTVKYGLHTADPEDVKRALMGHGPVKLRFGKTSLFPPNKEDGYEVVKVDIESPDLQRLNKKIASALPHTDTHPDYHPHATVAYVKIGKGKQYSGDAALHGREVTADRITFSSKNGKKTSISLVGTGRRRKYYGEVD